MTIQCPQPKKMPFCWRLPKWDLVWSGIYSKHRIRRVGDSVHPPPSKYPLGACAVTAGKWTRRQKICAVKTATLVPSEFNSSCNVGAIAQITSSNSFAPFLPLQTIVSGLRCFDLRSVQSVLQLECKEDMAAYRLAANRHLVLWLWVSAQPKLYYLQN